MEFAESKTENGSQVYNFIFSYYRKGSLGPLAAILPFEGATHCMELPYLFGKSILSEFEVQEEDSVVMDRFVTMLTNFIKTGLVFWLLENDLYFVKVLNKESYFVTFCKNWF